MTEHELSKEKIGELHNEAGRRHNFLTSEAMGDPSRERQITIARAAYDLGKAAQNDDEFIPCEFEDIRKGDTVERTIITSNGTVIITLAVADHTSARGNWMDSNGLTITGDDIDATYRRKPAPVVHPDPEKHPVILDGDGDAWVWRPIAEKYECVAIRAQANPEHFGNDWRPAKVVAKEED